MVVNKKESLEAQRRILETREKKKENIINMNISVIRKFALREQEKMIYTSMYRKHMHRHKLSQSK